jgi:hypothetical protein
VTDPFAPLKDSAWREIEAIDERLARGEIDEGQWHREIEALAVPAYLEAKTPWQQSGKSGSAADWEWSRSLIADAIDRDGTFLDIGCATVTSWNVCRVGPVEHESEQTTEQFLLDGGFEPSGRSERQNRRKPGMRYRVLGLN